MKRTHRYWVIPVALAIIAGGVLSSCAGSGSTNDSAYWVMANNCWPSSPSTPGIRVQSEPSLTNWAAADAAIGGVDNWNNASDNAIGGGTGLNSHAPNLDLAPYFWSQVALFSFFQYSEPSNPTIVGVTLGHPCYPTPGGVVCRMGFNLGGAFTGESTLTRRLAGTHELGHCLGLGHQAFQNGVANWHPTDHDCWWIAAMFWRVDRATLCLKNTPTGFDVQPINGYYS